MRQRIRIYNAQLTLSSRFFVLFVRLNDLVGTFFIIQWIQNLVQPWITLFFIQEINELFNVDEIGLALRAMFVIRINYNME